MWSLSHHGFCSIHVNDTLKDTQTQLLNMLTLLHMVSVVEKYDSKPTSLKSWLINLNKQTEQQARDVKAKKILLNCICLVLWRTLLRTDSLYRSHERSSPMFWYVHMPMDTVTSIRLSAKLHLVSGWLDHYCSLACILWGRINFPFGPETADSDLQMLSWFALLSWRLSETNSIH